MRCRGGHSPARRCIGAINRLSLKWHWPQNCHCEGALRPWQSREGSYVFAGSILLFNRVLRDSHVASLLGMTNLGTSRHKIHTSNIASLQGAHYPQGARRIRKAAKPRQRLRSERRYRRNWSVHFIDALYELQVPSRDCIPRALPRASRSGRHVGLRPPRNDKSGSQCHFNDSLYWLQVRCRDRHAAPLQLSARSVALIIHCRSIFFYCCGSFFPT